MNMEMMMINIGKFGKFKNIFASELPGNCIYTISNKCRHHAIFIKTTNKHACFLSDVYIKYISIIHVQNGIFPIDSFQQSEHNFMNSRRRY